MDQYAGALPYETYRARQAQQAAEEAAAKPLDVTDPGGRFLSAEGTEIDANGMPLKAKAAANPAPAGSHAALDPEVPGDGAEAAREAAQKEANTAAQKTKTQAKADPRSEDPKG